MEKLIQQFQARLKSVDLKFKRYLLEQINWNNRLIAIIGARGVGKTTMILQHIKETHKNINEVLYVSLDSFYFGKTALLDFADEFVKYGGKYLYLDEIHKYPNWSVEIKNIYDIYPELKIIITGSSALDIHKGKADLSRRIIVYKMNGLSFREFIKFKYDIDIQRYELDEIVEHSIEITQSINKLIKPLKFFNEYLKIGYYPFFIEDTLNYYERIEQVTNQVIDIDLPNIEKIDYRAVYNIKKLLSIISEIVPFKPNVSKLSEQIGINRDTFLKYLYWLHRADLLLLLSTDTYGISKLTKPEKIYLNNPNLIYTLNENIVNTGTVRETFFYNQVKVKHKLFYSKVGDFNIDNRYTFEIGGKNKTKKQIINIKNAFIAADNIEYAYQNKIPIWLFGFIY